MHIQRYQNGCVYKRGKSEKVWYGRFREDMLTPNGDVIRRTRNVRLGTLAELPSKATAVIRLQGKIAFHKPKASMILSELHKRWEVAELPTIKRNTARYYQKILRCHILPSFGQQEISGINRENVQTFLASKAPKYSTSSLRGMRVSMGRVLTWAVDCGWLDKNPCSKVPLPRAGKGQVKRTILAPQQVIAIAERLQEPYATLVLLVAITGVRIGEASAFMWSDFDGDVLHVSRTVYEGYTDTAKTVSSIRGLPLPEVLIKRMKELPEGKFIFASRVGTPVNAGNALKRYVRPVAKELGIQLTGWHDFRHTLATQLLTEGCSPKVVSRMLGHANVGITLNIYEHTDTEAFRAPLERMAVQLLPTVTKALHPTESNG
jgi:integrase